MNKVFEYKGFHFKAIKNLTSAERKGNAFIENLGTDKLLSGEFDYNEFYKIAPNKDIFYCQETKKLYLPLTSSGEKGQLTEYVTNLEQLLNVIKYVIVSNCSYPMIVTQLAHTFKGCDEVVSYLPYPTITDDALMFDSEEQAKKVLKSQPKWIQEQHKIKTIVGHLGCWRLL